MKNYVIESWLPFKILFFPKISADLENDSRISDSDAISLPKTIDEMLEDIDRGINYPREREKERQFIVSTMMPNLPTSLLIDRSIQLAIEEKQRGAASNTEI